MPPAGKLEVPAEHRSAGFELREGVVRHARERSARPPPASIQGTGSPMRFVVSVGFSSSCGEAFGASPNVLNGQ